MALVLLSLHSPPPPPIHTHARARAQAGDWQYTEEELERAAAIMGYGAVKYADLRNSRLTNYKFSFDTMLDLKGNTAVYLLYAHARIAGIVRKSGRDVDELLTAGASVRLGHPKERELAMALGRVSAWGGCGGGARARGQWLPASVCRCTAGPAVAVVHDTGTLRLARCTTHVRAHPRARTL
jgi:hypothetical protein